MDFEKLLHVARKNELNKKEPTKCLQTRFKPPSKEQREKEKILSENVRKFLAKQEEEEQKKQRDAEKRKKELAALRAKDPKAHKRIQTMLKRTKSANKSVMEDAIDNNNTADTLAGPSQPDEDDYGFVSESSSQLYNKLIQKMYSTPSDDLPKFAPSKKPTTANLMSTKERVKMALLKQEEDEKLPHKRKRKSKDPNKDGENDCDAELDYSAPERNIGSGSDREKEKDKEKIKRKAMPPPVDFHSLLKIAEQKQHEPIVMEPKIKKQEPEVLMTKKQKLEYEKLQEWKRRRELRLQSIENGEKPDSSTAEKGTAKRIPKISQSTAEQKPVTSKSSKIPKLSGGGSSGNCVNNNNSKSSSNNSSSSSSSNNNSNHEGKAKPGHDSDKSSSTSISKITSDRKSNEKDKRHKDLDDETARLKKERDDALRILKEKERLIREKDEAMRKLKEKEQLIRERDEALRKLKLLEKSEKISKAPLKDDSKLKSEKSQKPDGPSAKVAPRNGIRNETNRPNVKPNMSRDVPRSGGREFPPKDTIRNMTRPGGREFPPKDVQRSRQFPLGDVRRKQQPMKRRRLMDSDEEDYDSELDDFIDYGDEGEGAEDVSKVISEIFRYDKNKYSRYDDADDECMESNFAEISKEEFISTKCGILEDLQDIQKEKAMLARKKKR